jgi:RHS repeat-associated protein
MLEDGFQGTKNDSCIVLLGSRRGHDALGSIRDVTTATASSVFSSNYEPYGHSYGLTETLSIFNFEYTHKPYDSATGLYYYGARFYDPAIERFITEDSMQYSSNIQNPLSLNRYIYAQNNPETMNDPSGHMAIASLGYYGERGSYNEFLQSEEEEQANDLGIVRTERVLQSEVSLTESSSLVVTRVSPTTTMIVNNRLLRPQAPFSSSDSFSGLRNWVRGVASSYEDQPAGYKIAIGVGISALGIAMIAAGVAAVGGGLGTGPGDIPIGFFAAEDIAVGVGITVLGVSLTIRGLTEINW